MAPGVGVDDCALSLGFYEATAAERSDTFIEWSGKTWREWLEKTGELLWMSERDGWTHLWLYDVATGAVKNQVTRGEWVVRQVLRVDAPRRQVWFLAGGVRAGEDPYYRQLCRVNLDGSGFRQLTEGAGHHTVEFSSDRRHIVARWSRVDHPTVTELHRSEDGALVCELERADVSHLLATGWNVPERFVAEGRDGSTDIQGILIKTSHFDPANKYSVVEEVYAGPHGFFVPKTFGRLLLVGELDTNVDPASTLQVVHALQKAGKEFEYLPIMGTGHGAAETPYGSLRRMEFFARHLLGTAARP